MHFKANRAVAFKYENVREIRELLPQEQEIRGRNQNNQQVLRNV